MKRIALYLMIACLLTVSLPAFARDYEISKKAGDFSVQININRNPPATGDNKMSIAVKDAEGKPVTDAAVAIEYGMPAMPGMGAMAYKAAAAPEGEKYSAKLNFSMSGPWYVNIKINRSGKTQTVKLNVDVK